MDKKQTAILKKTPEKKLVQLSLHKVPDSVRNTVLSDKTASKTTEKNREIRHGLPALGPTRNNRYFR